MSEPPHAIVAGAGIGGLASAIALARRGLRVTVLEREAVLGDAGAGLQLAPNATGLLRELGLLDRVMALGASPEILRMRRARDGAELARLPLGPVAERRWGAPYLVIHRADLRRAFIDACAAEPAIALSAGATVTGFAASDAKVEVAVRREERAERVEGDLLIGADGLRSALRARIGLGLNDAPVWSGRTAWRALAPAAGAPDFALKLETGLWLGSRAHLVHYPVRGGAFVNLVAVTQDSSRAQDAPDIWSIPGDAREVARSFARWARPARDLVDATREWRRWPLFDRDPVRRWSLGRVALLGDAAHPMLPFFAQGAAQAIEDAAALGRAFTDRDVPPGAALAAYAAARSERAAHVVISSRRQGSIYHLGGPAALLRDAVIRRLGPQKLMDRLDWLYNYAPETA